jgi:hypothetical protein
MYAVPERPNPFSARIYRPCASHSRENGAPDQPSSEPPNT